MIASTIERSAEFFSYPTHQRWALATASRSIALKTGCPIHLNVARPIASHIQNIRVVSK
ncbi:MAG: hypothetical protein RBJ76_23335 [Stenomitos frigidus ULC029]